MAQVKQFEKILDILLRADGEAVPKDEILKELEGQIADYRLSSYIWDIRNKTEIPVESIKVGRKVVGYRISVGETPDEVAPAAAPEPVSQTFVEPEPVVVEDANPSWAIGYNNGA